MPTFSIKVGQPAQFEVPGFSVGQMQGLGESMIDNMKQRIGNSVNVFDAPAKPLSKRYAKLKQRRGAKPVRDLRLTGKTLASLNVLNVSEKSVTVGFNDSESYKKALFAQNIDPLFGLSPANVETVTEKAMQFLGENASDKFHSR